MSEELVATIADLLRELGPVRWKRFFSGHALLIGETQFAIVRRDGSMYFRADEALAESLAAEGSKPFVVPRKRGALTIRGYQSVPEAWLDDEETLLAWSRRALDAARKRDAAKAKRKRRKS